MFSDSFNFKASRSFSLIFCSGLLMVGCSSSEKKKVTEVDTKLKNEVLLGSGESIGVKEDELLFQKKTNLVTEITNLENEVILLEDRVFGSKMHGSKGLMGEYDKCRVKRAEVTGVYSGKIKEAAYQKDSQRKIYIEKGSGRLITLTQENLEDRFKKLSGYKVVLEDAENEIQDYLTQCQLDLKKGP